MRRKLFFYKTAFFPNIQFPIKGEEKFNHDLSYFNVRLPKLIIINEKKIMRNELFKIISH